MSCCLLNNPWLNVILYLILAPLAGGLLAGLDRIISARLQGRVGPPITQPFWDVAKLLKKRTIAVTHLQMLYLSCFLIFIVLSGCLFFFGGDLLLAVFALTVGSVMLALAAFAPNSPYSNIGAERELIQMMAYEPMLILTVLGLYQVTGSFQVADLLAHDQPLLYSLPGVFIGFLFILTIKLRKSPFDLSTSHHAHQELVKGLTTDMSGSHLAVLEIAHWYENIFLLGLVYLFFAAWHPAVAIGLTALTYALEVLIDNTYARLTWRTTLKSAWITTAVFGVTNLIVIFYVF